MRFYLGTHEPAWLAQTAVPLFVSRVRLERRKTLPRALGPWVLDSGGFSELDAAGRWSLGPREYAAFVRRCRDEIGGLQWAAVQDWMCEPRILGMTGEAVEDHQLRTVVSYLDLRDLAPDLPWAPVLQGWSMWDYHRHAEQYRRLGVDLAALPVVGVGTVCRRQDTVTGALVISQLVGAFGFTNLHGFGFKMQGLDLVGGRLASADSLAWSMHAGKRDPLPGCTHKQCRNCIRYALAWRERVLARLTPPAPAPAGPPSLF